MNEWMNNVNEIIFFSLHRLESSLIIMKEASSSNLTVMSTNEGDDKSLKCIPFQLFNNSIIVYVLGAIGFLWLHARNTIKQLESPHSSTVIQWIKIIHDRKIYRVVERESDWLWGPLTLNLKSQRSSKGNFWRVWAWDAVKTKSKKTEVYI